jgi:hypothetical protein
MTISFDVPGDVEELFRRTGQNPAAGLKESALVDLYRQRKLTHHQLGEALGVARFETDAVLKRHLVPLGMTVEELTREVEGLRADLAR